jgi:trigger factor
MQVTETLSEGLKRAFTVVVPAADIEGKCDAKLTDISRTIKLPGFRPGKVPVKLVRQRYGSAVLAEVMQDQLDKATGKVIEDRGLRPAGQPKIALTAQPDLASGKAQDLAFSVELEILPDITAPDLSGIKLTRLRTLVTPEQQETMLTGIAQRQREMLDVTEDRGAAAGDVLTIDFTGSIDGVPFEGGKGGDVGVEIGGSGFIPGFVEQLEGMRPGEERRIEVTFPEAYNAEHLRGKQAAFDVTAKALKHPVEQPIDDAFAIKLGFESLEKLREAVSTQIQQEFDQTSRLRIKRELLDILAARADFPAPQNLVEFEFNAIWARVESDMKQGQIDDEDRGKDTDTLRAEYRAIADRRVRLGLLLSDIGRTAGVQVSQAELNNALRMEASRYPGSEMQVIEFFRKTPQAIEQLRGPIFEDKVVDYILELAQVEERIVTPEVLNEPQPEDPASTATDDSPLLRALTVAVAEVAAEAGVDLGPEHVTLDHEPDAAPQAPAVLEHDHGDAAQSEAGSDEAA